MNVESACAFFKEIVIRHSVPATMYYGHGQVLRILISRENVPQSIQDEIANEAEQRGFEVRYGIYELMLYG